MNVLDLFAGVGGFSYGFKLAGFKIKGAIELNKLIAFSMKKNHKNTKVFIGDIRNINPVNVKKKIGKIDVIIGGPPCQGFSLKGKREGFNDERNFLFENYLKYVKFFSPKFAIMENVPMILTDKNGFFKKKIISSFKQMGYEVNFGILNASNFGVPQNRKRAVFIASMGQKINLPVSKMKKVSVWEAISDLAYLESGEGLFESEYKIVPQSKYQKKMRTNSNKLFNHVVTKHKKITLNRLKRIPPEKGKEFLKEKITSTFGETWGRLVKNQLSPTIVTRFDTPSNGKNSHPYLNRAITPREAARIQSFPDTFVFFGNKTSINRQIGNAVPPLLAKAIALQLLST